MAPENGTRNAGNRPRLRLRITAAAEAQVRAGHPWVFADSVRGQNREGGAGELAAIYDRKDKFLAVGLYEPDSPIRVRVLHAGKPQRIDAEWWAARLDAAIRRRDGLFDERTTGYRLINGESDGWPGLVLDRYDATLVMKIYTAGWLRRLKEITALIRPRLNAERIVLRASRNLQTVFEKREIPTFHEPHLQVVGNEGGDQKRFMVPMHARKRKEAPHELAARPLPPHPALCPGGGVGGRSVTDGQILIGDRLEACPTFLESGLRFEADVLRGQKTGFFLDQRENRRIVETLAHGRTMLNAFSFSGGFSLYAARGGAESVTDLDISAHALEAGKRNFKLNQNEPAVGCCHHEQVQADAFKWLAENPKRKFDLIVLDPPSLAKREAERAGAIRAYARLTELGIKQLSTDGILLACSCSAHVSADEFFGVVRQSAAKSGRRFTELQRTHHAPDHPATFKEARYLKGIYLRFS